jgi:hypothetical protein
LVVEVVGNVYVYVPAPSPFSTSVPCPVDAGLYIVGFFVDVPDLVYVVNGDTMPFASFEKKLSENRGAIAVFTE